MKRRVTGHPGYPDGSVAETMQNTCLSKYHD